MKVNEKYFNNFNNIHFRNCVNLKRTIMKEILSKILELLKLCECEKKKITKIKYININTNLNESRIITVFSNSPIHQELVIL